MRLGLTLAIWHIILPSKVAMTESVDSTPTDTDAMAVNKLDENNTGRSLKTDAKRNKEESKFNTDNWKTYIDGWMTEVTLPGTKTNTQRYTDGITQYNAAHMNRTGAENISSHYSWKIMTIQSTGRQSTEVMFTEHTKNHMVIHFPCELNKQRRE